MAASIAGGLIGQAAAANDIGQSKSFANQEVQPFTSLDLGPDAGRAYNFQQEQLQGTLTPAQVQNINQGQNALAQIQQDPSLRNAQVSALNQLSQVGRSGFTPADQAAIAQLMQQTATNEQAKNAQIMQEYAQRGQAGSGAQLAAQLAASQNGSNLANQNALQLGGQASQNALSALAQAGNLGGSIRGQDFSNASQVAQAQNAINQFNTQNQLANQQFNVQNANAAQQANLQNKQQTANFNSNLANQAQMLQRQGEQEMFQRRLAQAQGTSAGAKGASQAFGQIGSNTAQGYANMGAGLDQGAESVMGGSGGSGGGGGGGVASMAALFSDKNMKTDIIPLETSQYETVPTYLYRYKDEKHGKGWFKGTMAQDLLAIDPQHPAVIHTDAGMMVDYNKVK